MVHTSMEYYSAMKRNEIEPIVAAAKSLQSCLILCDPIDGSPPGSSVPGILQARILEWVAISFSKMSPDTAKCILSEGQMRPNMSVCSVT